MKRERFYERDQQFSRQEKEEIGWKSDDLCCHCGKFRYFGYGATVDHFIPLNKGGSNRNINLIMMCEDCNKEKGDKIVDLSYVPYLKTKYKDELAKYLDSYIHSFEYVGRDRLFAFDEYSIVYLNPLYYNLAEKRPAKQKKNIMPKKPMGTKYKLKIATYDDFDKICDYLEKYLKKYGYFDSRDAVEANIKFWMKFGCIYYMEKNGEVYLMTVFTVSHNADNDEYCGLTKSLNMYIFSYYSTDTAFGIAASIIEEFPRYIMDEQKLMFLPTIINVLDNDRIGPLLFESAGKGYSALAAYRANAFKAIMICMVNKKNSEVIFDEDNWGNQVPRLSDNETKKTKQFFEKFDEIENNIVQYAEEDPTFDACGWMIYDILSPNDIERLDLFKDYPKRKEQNRILIQTYACKQAGDYMRNKEKNQTNDSVNAS